MLPATTDSQRAALYQDVVQLLSPGFLTAPVVINGVALHLRSLCPGDLFMLQARAVYGNDDGWRLWTVASAIWMVDGVSILGQDAAIPRMAKFLRDQVRPATLDILFTQVLGLFTRTEKASEAIQLYCYEPTSRYRWRMSRKGETLTTGAPGAEKLGTNFIQGLWVAFNEVEDQKHQDESQWEGFKFVSSSNAPKAVAKIDAADRKKRQEEQERRQTALDRFYYYRMGAIDAEGYVKGRDSDALGARLQGPKSVESLEGEMKSWVSGDHDQHDRIVLEYKESIRIRQRQVQEEREARRKALETERTRRDATMSLDNPQPMVGLTAQQLQRVLSTRQPGPPGARWVSDGRPEGEAAYVHDKWIAQQEKSGRLRVEGGKIVADGVVPDTKRDQQLLNDLVENRQVQFGGGDD